MATSITSFYYAIYKRLWAVGCNSNVHTDDMNSYGGFSLRSLEEPNGIFGACSEAPYVGQKPLKAGDNNPDNNPIYKQLWTGLATPNPPFNIVVNGETWPVMPYPFNNSIQSYTLWLKYNDAAKPPRVIDALHDWIAIDHKPDDRPKGNAIKFSTVSKPPAAFPLKKQPKKEDAQILFVASMTNDSGRRPGDGAMPDPPAVAVPANYWDTSQIFVTDTAGNDQGLPDFKAGAEHYIAAIIGNAGNLYAGTAQSAGLPPVNVVCNAYVFNTFLSPGVALPSLHNLAVANSNTVYEQLYLKPLSRDLVGFRFDVDKVFKGLTAAMVAANFTPQKLMGLTVDEWLKSGHACVKVLITGGELASPYTGAWPTENSLPTKDRHIAQRNLAQFDMTLMGAKQIKWQTFVMSQAGKGLNALGVAHGLPADACQLYLAVSTQAFERYIAEGGSTRGFARVREPEAKPFPDAVILRQTTPGARLRIANHARAPFFGMAVGLEWDPAKLKGRKQLGDVVVTHYADDRSVAGGFTLRLRATR